jgi:hypothetical protein
MAAAPAGGVKDFIKGGMELIFVPAGNRDISACLRQAAGHRLAQSFAAAGDQSHFAVQIEDV